MREEAYNKLAEAIILQAVHDYKKALRQLSILKNPRTNKEIKEECERFFYSEWGDTLSPIDLTLIVEGQKNHEQKKKYKKR